MTMRPASWLVLLSIALGCTTEPDPASSPETAFELESAQGLASARVEVEGAKLVRGPNVLLVDLAASEAGASPTLGAANALMPAHGHSSEGTTLGGMDGSYRVELDLYMAGRWDVVLDVTLGDSADRFDFSLDVP